ncbi:MAG TPA: sporulation protein YqfD, partial [Lachnospiraceae bacterium]|nr:sporulation protein YqfD [Lachnospiraceae bacterium]
MLIKLIKWFRGYLLVTIKGYSPERFINLCSAKNILIWNLMQTKEGYEFNISVQGFKQLRQVVRKTKTRPFII